MWCENVIHVDHGGTPDQDMCDADRAVIKAWAIAHWRAWADVDCALYEVKSWSLETTVPTKFAADRWYPLSHVVGTSSTKAGPPDLALCMSLRTGLTTDSPKPPRGRLFHVGGPPLAYYVAGTDSVDGAGAGTPVRQVYEELLAAFTGTGDVGTWVLVSWWSGGTRAAPVLRGTPAVLPITRIKCNNRLNSVMRRQRNQPSYVGN